MCGESTYSGVGAKKVPQNVVLRTVTAHSSRGTDAIIRRFEVSNDFVRLGLEDGSKSKIMNKYLKTGSTNLNS